MEFYHLVTRKPMTVGQIIDFTDGQYNRLYEFWMKREERTSDGKDAFDVLQKKQLTEEDNSVITSYVFNQSRAVREAITEMVRLKFFPERPSRFSCLYVCKTYEEAMFWKENFESFGRKPLQLVKVRSDRKGFSGDASFLPLVNGDSFEKKMQQAYKYWEKECSGEMAEILLDGKIEVTQIIEEY